MPKHQPRTDTTGVSRKYCVRNETDGKKNVATWGQILVGTKPFWAQRMGVKQHTCGLKHQMQCGALTINGHASNFFESSGKQPITHDPIVPSSQGTYRCLRRWPAWHLNFGDTADGGVSRDLCSPSTVAKHRKVICPTHRFLLCCVNMCQYLIFIMIQWAMIIIHTAQSCPYLIYTRWCPMLS